MNLFRLFFISLLFFGIQSTKAQFNKDGYILKKQEVALLDIISQDTINSLSIHLDSDIFNFGFIKPRLNTIALIKKKKEIFLQAMGTGHVYKIFKKTTGAYQLRQLDSTLFLGANFNAITFFVNDTLFQYAGDGFWHIRGIMTYFSNKTNEWELYDANRLVNVFWSTHNDLLFQVDQESRKLYLSNAFIQREFPKTLNVEKIDSCYEFDFSNHNWKTLGKLNPQLLKLINNNSFDFYTIGKYLIMQSYLKHYWINFSENSFGEIKDNYDAKIKDIWLSIYKNNNPYKSIQFSMGNTVYYVRIDMKNELTYLSYIFEKDAFDTSKNNKIYSNDVPFIESIKQNYNILISILIIGIFLILIINYVYFKIKKRKIIPKEVAVILNDNFYNSLTNIEKELIEVLYHHQLKGESISTKIINKIIGVQLKDTMTQNKNRSDYFLKINQKFKLATRNNLPLIIKNRDSIDKRQFNYGLQDSYLNDLAKFFRN